MKIAKVIALLGLLTMTGILIFGFTVGNFNTEGARLLSMPWGIVSLVDLYVGFILFSCWIVFREKALVPSIIWTVLMMVMGFWKGHSIHSWLYKAAMATGNVSGTANMRK